MLKSLGGGGGILPRAWRSSGRVLSLASERGLGRASGVINVDGVQKLRGLKADGGHSAGCKSLQEPVRGCKKQKVIAPKGAEKVQIFWGLVDRLPFVYRVDRDSVGGNIFLELGWVRIGSAEVGG